MASNHVLCEISKRIATVTLNRPDKLNALDTALCSELLEILRNISNDSAVRVLVLAGAGRGFCAGGDLDIIAAADHRDDRARVINALLTCFQQVTTLLFGIDIPTVAAIHGPAVGAGMSLAVVCDFRIAAQGSTFNQAFIQLGLTPDGGSTWLLPRLIGLTRSVQLMMTGETIDADRAFEWGLLNKVTPPGEHLRQAMELARQLATLSPSALRQLKHLIRSSCSFSFYDQLKAEDLAQEANAVSDSEYLRAAMERFRGKQR